MGCGQNLANMQDNHTMTDLCQSHTESDNKLPLKFTLFSAYTQSRSMLAERLKRSDFNRKFRDSSPSARSADETQQGRNSCPLLH